MSRSTGAKVGDHGGEASADCVGHFAPATIVILLFAIWQVREHVVPKQDQEESHDDGDDGNKCQPHNENGKVVGLVWWKRDDL